MDPKKQDKHQRNPKTGDKNNGKTGKQIAAGALGGFGSGFFRGVRTGAAKGNVFTNASKGFKEQRTADDKYDQLITSGGSIGGKIKSGITSFFGETKGQTYTRQLHNMDTISNFKKDIQSAADEISFVKSAKTTWEQAVQEKGESIAQFEARKQGLRDLASQAAIEGKSVVKGEYESVTIASDGKTKVKTKVSFSENIDGSDTMYAGDVRSKFSEAQSFVENRNVEVWNETTRSYERAKPISKFSDLKDLDDQAHETKTHIYGTEEKYHESIANDKAAGIDSNATVNK